MAFISSWLSVDVRLVKDPKEAVNISLLSYALADFCRLHSLPEFLTCTDKLQQWSKPRCQHVTKIPVDKLGSLRRQLSDKKRSYGSGMVFDPCPITLRKSNPLAL